MLPPLLPETKIGALIFEIEISVRITNLSEGNSLSYKKEEKKENDCIAHC